MNIIEVLGTFSMNRSAFIHIVERNRFIAALLGYRRYETVLKGPHPNASAYEVLIDPDYNNNPNEFIKLMGFNNDDYTSVDDVDFTEQTTPTFLFDTFSNGNGWTISHLERRGDLWFGYASKPGKFVSFDNAMNMTYLIIALALLVLIEEYEFAKHGLLYHEFDLY